LNNINNKYCLANSVSPGANVEEIIWYDTKTKR